MATRIEIVDPARTFPLRQAVLRPMLSLEEVARRDVPGLTFAALDERDEVLSSGTLLQDVPPAVVPAGATAGRTSFRLRFMATWSDHRSTGLGATVLQALTDHIASTGGGLLWCNAREGAVAFYERAGFVTAGARFVEADIGGHFVMWRIVPPLAEGSAAGGDASNLCSGVEP